MEKQGASVASERDVNKYSDEEISFNNDDELIDTENTNARNINEILTDICEKLKSLEAKVNQIESKQDTVDHRSFSLKPLTEEHDKEIKSLKKQQNKICGDISKFSKDLQKLHDEQTKIMSEVSDLNQDFNPDKTLVVTNLPSSIGNMYDWANTLIHALGGSNEMIVNVTRTPRCDSRKAVLEIRVKSVKEKIQLLRQKSKLKETRGLNNVYIRSSKSHHEHVCDLNFRTVLDELQQGKQYRITSNGRIVKRNEKLPANRQRGQNKSNIPTVPGSSVNQPKVKREMRPLVQAMQIKHVVRPKTQSQNQVHFPQFIIVYFSH